jgi:ethanolamine utilization protein EutA
MSEPVTLVGLDFGTTTSSAVVATARLVSNVLTGRFELDQVRERYRSDMAFTPMCDDRIDERRVEAHLDAWLAAGGVRPDEVFGGGALLTGLTARRANAGAIVRLVRARLGGALVATADDPRLESWLAFMGGCAPLSRLHPRVHFLNLDIGGGTTNLALGLAGEVLRTGCLFIGARHVRVVPGTYRIVELSRYALALLAHLGIGKRPGDDLAGRELEAILDWYTSALEAAVTGTDGTDEITRLHEQAPFRLPGGLDEVRVTFSGGVGELIYAHLRGDPWPPTTAFGDLGIDLARRIASRSLWADSLRRFAPPAAGRATVYGLLRHNTEVSGCTVFLPTPSPLPLTDLPILGSLSPASTPDQMRELLGLVRASACGGCLRVSLGGTGVAAVRELGTRVAQAATECAFPPRHPLVLLLSENLGKALGHYVTRWGAVPLELVVIDEVAHRDAHYAQVGVPRRQVIPISFYGLNQ